MMDTENQEELEYLMNHYGDEIMRFCTLQLKDPFQAEDAHRTPLSRPGKHWISGLLPSF